MVVVRSVKVAFVRSVKAADSAAAGPMAARPGPGSSMKRVVCTVRVAAPASSNLDFFVFSSGFEFHQHLHLNPDVLQPWFDFIFSSSLDSSK